MYINGLLRYGYVYRRCPDHPFANERKLVREHRLVVEEYLSKKYGHPTFLFPCWHVHHIDHNRLNNDISNLMICTQKEHLLIHSREKPMTGRRYSEEWRKHMSQGHMGHSVSQETREKIRKKNVGHLCSEETRNKIRKSKEGFTHTTESKKKITQLLMGNKYMNGRKLSDEWKEHIGAGSRAAWVLRKAKLS